MVPILRTPALHLVLVTLLLAPHLAAADDSRLWGAMGERWDPRGRLPDFSYAGYRQGRVPIPDVPVAVDVRDFGAVGDGVANDTGAIRRAMEAAGEMGGGAVLLPAGTYRVQNVLRFDRGGVVLRGEGPGQTILAIDADLRQVRGEVYSSAGTIQWSWKGGFIAAESRTQIGRIPVIENAERGDRWLTLEQTDELSVGDVVVLKLADDGSHSLASELYAGQASASRCEGKLYWPVQIAAIDGERIQLAQPLRLAVRGRWSPRIIRYQPLREIGVEHLAIEFPGDAYRGHHRERGYNAIDFGEDPLVVDAWIRDVRIANADNGIFLQRSKNVTVENVRIVGNRLGPLEQIWVDSPFGYVPADRHSGHHGITAGVDSLIHDVEIGADFIHELTATDESVGSVFSNVRSTDPDGLSLDHHGHAAPLENLFTHIRGKYDFLSGGLACGVQSGARGTFWGFGHALHSPPWDEVQTNLVGRLADGVDERDSPVRRWRENVEDLAPNNLWRAQLRRRLAIEDLAGVFATTSFGSRALFVESNAEHWGVIEVDGDARYWLATSRQASETPGMLGVTSLADTGPLGDATIRTRARTAATEDGVSDFALILGHEDDERYYYAAFTSDPERGGIHIVDGGSVVRLASATLPEAPDAATHAATFSREGDVLTMRWEDAVIAEVRDGTLGEGWVGLGSLGSAVYFDDVEVEAPALAPPAPAPTGGDAGAADDAVPPESLPPEDIVGGSCAASSRRAAGCASPILVALLVTAIRLRRSRR
jgi:hypothetical protein